jgi:hypothetical protein
MFILLLILLSHIDHLCGDFKFNRKLLLGVQTAKRKYYTLRLKVLT